MRTVFLLLLTISLSASAQLYIGPGAQLQMSNNAQLTLRDMNFVNSGSFAAGNGAVLFSGTDYSYIGGAQPTQFYIVRIDKENGRLVSLYRPLTVNNEVQFSRGNIDLNSYDLDLGSTGRLIGESETSRIEGPAGGEVLINATLNAPSNANPGNLGAVISSPQNLGSVLIKRGHTAYSLTGGESILRYYHITPTNNAGLGATLRFRYFDAELNGLTESTLGKWRSVDGAAWTYQHYSIRDAALNFVEKTGIDAFSIWTLATQSNPLPVTFTSFNLQCDRDKVIVRWKTSLEVNSSHFVVERNSNGVWTSIGQLPAAGNSGSEKSYEFIDHNPAGKAYYRIAQYDRDGQMKYTNTIVADCSLTDALQAWPNPFQQVFTIRINTNSRSQGSLRVVDVTGRVIINRTVSVQSGVNQFEVDLNNAAKGAYLLTVEWGDGRQIKTMRLIKQ